ncbi:MAG: nuclear transport factor 2 family protein [Actinomycetota bacterium]|nr:nuclear transport factor 2 family protein [Actinomycetota bacterium]
MNGVAAREVLDVQRLDVWGAMRAKDPEAWMRVLADDFILRTPGEEDRDRSAFVERMTSFPGEVVSIACHDLRADAFGTAVVVTGVQHAVIRMPNGARLEDFTMMSNVFVTRAGRWLMVLAHSLSLPM